MFKMGGAAPQRPSELMEETSWDIICQSVKSQWWPLIPSCQQTEWEKTRQTCEEECRQRCSDVRRLFSTLTNHSKEQRKWWFLQASKTSTATCLWGAHVHVNMVTAAVPGQERQRKITGILMDRIGQDTSNEELHAGSVIVTETGT